MWTGIQDLRRQRAPSDLFLHPAQHPGAAGSQPDRDETGGKLYGSIFEFYRSGRCVSHDILGAAGTDRPEGIQTVSVSAVDVYKRQVSGQPGADLR